MSVGSVSRIVEVWLAKDLSGGANPLVDSRYTALPKTQWVAGDAFTVRLRWLERPASVMAAPVPAMLPGSWALVLAVKATRTSQAALLASASVWSQGLSGDGTDVWYDAVLSLDTEAMLAAVGAAALDVYIDVEVQDSTNSQRLTWQWPGTIVPGVYRGETAPVPAVPAYPSPGTIPTRIVGSVPVDVGAAEVAVSVVSAVAFVPVVSVRKPSATAPGIFAAGVHTLTTAGFTVSLSSPPQEVGYVVDYIAF